MLTSHQPKYSDPIQRFLQSFQKGHLWLYFVAVFWLRTDQNTAIQYSDLYTNGTDLSRLAYVEAVEDPTRDSLEIAISQSRSLGIGIVQGLAGRSQRFSFPRSHSEFSFFQKRATMVLLLPIL
jgi:hypothetical protein